MKVALVAAVVLSCAGPSAAQGKPCRRSNALRVRVVREPLATLSSVAVIGDANQVDEYRARYYLALGEVSSSRLVTTSFTGTLEVLVDEKGGVESVGVLQKTGTAYDAQLLEAARKWRHQPAKRGGVPVKYRRTVGFVLRGQEQTQPQLPVRE